MQDPIVFSGAGVVSAAGIGISESFDSMMRGESFMRPSRTWDAAGCNTEYYGEVPASNQDLLDGIRLRLRSARLIAPERGELMFLNALQEALDRAEIDLARTDRSRVALLAGTSLSGFTNLERSWRVHLETGAPPPAEHILAYPLNVLVDRAAYELDLSGPRYLFSTACSASLHPVIWGMHLLDRDEADVVILGGADPLSLISMVGFSCLRSVARRSSTPFSLGDPGVSIGEGAGVVVMERLSNFRKRSARDVAAFLAGASGNSDAYHPTASDPMGTSIRRCLEESLQGAKLEDGARGLLVAHGTGTLHNDKVESRAIYGVEALRSGTKVTSLKSMIGHTLGASGCVELALLVECMDRSQALPTANFSERRPGVDLDIIQNQGIDFAPDFGLKSAFAFGGNNVTVAMTRKAEQCVRTPFRYDPDEIVVTGAGVLTPFGDLPDDDFLRALAEGGTCIGRMEPVRGFTGERTSEMAALVDEAGLSTWCDKHRIKDHRKMDRISRMAAIAAQKCLKSSGFAIKQQNAYDVGLISGTCTGHLESVSGFYTEFTQKGPALADAGLFPNTVVNAHAGYITIQLRLKGYTTVVTQGNLSGLAALDLAVRTLRAGTCKLMLAGSTSEYCRPHHQAMLDLGFADDDHQAYSDRSLGNVLGEGSAFLALERREDAVARGARILATLEEVQLGFAPAIPSTFSFRHNPLRRILRDRAVAAPSAILGDGNGHRPAMRLERDALHSAFPDLQPTSLSAQFGFVNGVMSILGIASAALASASSDPAATRWRGTVGSRPLFTCVSEGGGSGYARLRLPQ